MKKIILLFFLFFIISSCASQTDMNVLNDKIDRISQDQRRFKKEIRKEIEVLKKVFDNQLSKSSFFVRASQADIVSRIENLRIKLAKIEGEYDFLSKEIIEERNSTQSLIEKVSLIEKQVKEVYTDVYKLKTF